MKQKCNLVKECKPDEKFPSPDEIEITSDQKEMVEQIIQLFKEKKFTVRESHNLLSKVSVTIDHRANYLHL